MTRTRYARSRQRGRAPQRFTLLVSLTRNAFYALCDNVLQIAAEDECSAQLFSYLGQSLCPFHAGFGAMLYRWQLDRATRAIQYRYQSGYMHAAHFWREWSV